MKLILRSTLLVLATVGFAFAGEAATGKSTFKVNGMVCGSCENAVKTAALKVEGVTKVEANAEKGEVVVAYDPAKATPEKITAAINATKFKVEK